MTTASTTAPAQTEIHDAGHVDVLIVGAGVSGIGAAHHLREQFPGRTFVILDAQDNRGAAPGGPTKLHPGVRSDSDLFCTYGYRFGRGAARRSRRGGEILAYLERGHRRGRPRPGTIRFRHRVTTKSQLVHRGPPVDRRGHPGRHRSGNTAQRHRATPCGLPDDVPGATTTTPSPISRGAGEAWTQLPGRDRAPTAVARGPRPGRSKQARHRHRPPAPRPLRR